MSRGQTHPSPRTREAKTAAERRAETLRSAARGKSQAATVRAEAAIRQLVKSQQEITFRNVARAGRVSLDFLYGNAELRRRIESLRAQQGQPPAAPAAPPPAETDGHLVHVLTARLRAEHAARRSAVHDLEQQLAAAHGEILRLRRALQQHGIQA